jgi:hypothetical protein
VTADGTLVELPREQCVELLRVSTIGRVALAMPDAAPLVVPVNYVLDGETVVFRSDMGSKIAALRLNPVSFQVDFFDAAHRSGWSVLVQGVAYEATSWEVDHVDLESWVAGSKVHWVRIVPVSITGRHIRPAEAVLDVRGYL